MVFRPKLIPKKNVPHLRSGVDIFSQLSPILRSAGTSEVRLVLNAVWTRARPMRGTPCAGPRAVREPGAPHRGGVRQARALPYVMRDPGRESLARRGIARRAPLVVAPRSTMSTSPPAAGRSSWPAAAASASAWRIKCSRTILVSRKTPGFCAEVVHRGQLGCVLQPSKKRLFGENANQ